MPPARRLGMLSLAVALGCFVSGVASGSAQPTSVPRPCHTVPYRSAPQLDAQRVCMSSGVATHGTPSGTYLFLTPGGIDLRAGGAGIYRDDGTLVWWHGFRGQYNLTVVCYRGESYLAVWAGRPDSIHPYGDGTVALYNEHYQRVGLITTGKPFGPDHVDPHEFRITPQGDALLGIYEPVSTVYRGRRLEVYQYVVQKVSLINGPHGIRTGRVLFQWQSLQHVPLSRSHLPAPTNHTVWDYFHGNSISQDTDGNLLVSARNTWGIYKINAKTGAIMWEVGAPRDPALAQPWCYQHDIEPLGNDLYSVFDDGGLGPGCQGSARHQARGLVVRIDASQVPAQVTQVRADVHVPAIYSGCCGNMQDLPGGASLIDWGNVSGITQYAANGAVEMDLSTSAWSYRAYRFPWVGVPLTRPAVAAQRVHGGTRVWASWNGSTQVTAWRILAGSGGSQLGPIGAVRPKHGFETTVLLRRQYAEVAVEALDASGRVLSTSLAVSPGG